MAQELTVGQVTEHYTEGQEIFIISAKLKRTFSPFQKVVILRSIFEQDCVLYLVRDIRSELIWFGEQELREGVFQYERYASMTVGKQARLRKMQPQEIWNEDARRGYQMQVEADRLAKLSDRKPGSTPKY